MRLIKDSDQIKDKRMFCIVMRFDIFWPNKPKISVIRVGNPKQFKIKW